MNHLRHAPTPEAEVFAAAGGTEPSFLMLDTAGVSHPGNRPLNQDQHLIVDLAAARGRDASQALPSGASEEWLLVVADGMGGHHCGEVASLLAVSALVKELLRLPPEAADPLQRLDCALQCSDDTLHRAGTRRSDLANMGTTLTAAWWIAPLLYFAHVGDSRLYLLREGCLARLTRDHTVAADLLSAGLQRTKTVGFEHVLTQAVGGDEEGVNPQSGVRRLRAGDALLLCTDGLVRGVSDDEIASALQMADCARTAASALLAGALASDDGDNITAVTACVRRAPQGGALDASRA